MRSRPPRALLLEREPALRQVLEEVLTQLGFDVLASESRRRALELLLAAPDVDLAVVDLVDSAAGGEALVSFLRDARETAAIPLIVMTDGERATSPRGAVELAKPFGLEELVSAVRSCSPRLGDADADAPDHPR